MKADSVKQNKVQNRTQNRTQYLVFTAVLAALMAVLSQIVLPVGPVPFNLGVMGAFLTGLLLPPVWAAGAICVYLLLGLVGLPVFAGFGAGPAVLFGKTGGYLLGYLLIALLSSWGYRWQKQKQTGIRLAVTAVCMLAGLALCYLFGTLWFMTITRMDLVTSLGFCVIPFIVPDVCKGIAAYLLARALGRRISLL